MSNLRSRIATIAEDFATRVLAELKSASLEDLSNLAGSARPSASRARPQPAKPASEGSGANGKAARPTRIARVRKGGRRTAADLQKTAEVIVSLLKKHPEGMRSEQIQKALGLTKKDVFRPLGTAIAAGTIRKKGEKRATTYFAR